MKGGRNTARAKRAALISGLFLLLTSCSAKHGPNSPVGHRTGAIPIKCVQEAVLSEKSACYMTADPDWFTCDGIGVKAACITYKVNDGDVR